MDVIRDDIHDRFGEAYTNLLDATGLDAGFARPWVGLLALRLREHTPAIKPMTTEELQKIASKLNALLPHSAPAYVAQSAIEFVEWHFPQTEQCAEKAIAADPNYELARTFYAYMLTQWGKGRLDDAREQLAISEKLLAGKTAIPRCLGHIAYAERKFTNAIDFYSNALALEPHHAPAILFTARAYLAMGNYTNAIEKLRERGKLLATTEAAGRGADDRYNRLLEAYHAGGRKGYWEFWWQEFEPRTNDYYLKAVTRLNLGDTNGALGWLNASYTNHEHGEGYLTPLGSLLFHEYWDDLHDNPQFQENCKNYPEPSFKRTG